jgi:hypothetical protein
MTCAAALPLSAAANRKLVEQDVAASVSEVCQPQPRAADSGCPFRISLALTAATHSKDRTLSTIC